MGDTYPKFKAAAVQAAPVFLDREATIEKACKLIKEAGENGAELIVFPEVYIPTYPYWPKDLKGRKLGLEAWVRLYKNSVEIGSPECQVLCDAARKAGAYVIMGMNERDGGTLYNTQLFIGRSGNILGRHRKLVPTHSERVVWGMGDGSDLAVFKTDWGLMGGLICGEHFMTLSRFALFTKGEKIHIASWSGREGTTSTLDTMSKSYALEGQEWVILSAGYMTPDLVPDDFPMKEQTDWGARGGSGIISPRGSYVAGPLYDQEGIVYGDVDMEQVIWAKAMVDVIGHYARPDVTALLLNDHKQSPVKAVELETCTGEVYEEMEGVPGEY